MKPESRLTRWLITAAVLVSAVLVLWWDQTLRVKQVTDLADPELNFNYGGLATDGSIPYELFAVLPEVFDDLVPGPGGYESFGLIVEEGRRVPIGFARQTVGYEGVTPTCALCHTASYRVHPDSQRVIVAGAPTAADVTALDRFLRDVPGDPRFRASVLLPAMREAGFDLSPLEQLRYRIQIPFVRMSLFSHDGSSAWIDARPAPGWGRANVIGVLKYDVLGMEDDGSVGTTDPHALWNLRDRDGQRLQWAGVNRDLGEVHDLSLYTTVPGRDDPRLRTFNRVRAYLADLTSPPFPFPIDEAGARRGRALFEQTCAGCHEQGQGEVVPNDYVNTDPEALGVWTQPLREALTTVGDPPFAFDGLIETDGYVNVPLDGIWMRAPYLHNGSVPSLRHLLEPADRRPETFFRWNDVYLPNEMGFEWTEPPPGSTLDDPYDTRLRGNGNGGHEFGTELTADQKNDLIEYLKTL
jgi:hypothetical protein